MYIAHFVHSDFFDLFLDRNRQRYLYPVYTSVILDCPDGSGSQVDRCSDTQVVILSSGLFVRLSSGQQPVGQVEENCPASWSNTCDTELHFTENRAAAVALILQLTLAGAIIISHNLT